MRSFNKLAICSEAFSSRLLGITRLAGRGRSSGQRYRVTSHGNWSRSEPGSEGAGTNDQDDRYTHPGRFHFGCDHADGNHVFAK